MLNSFAKKLSLDLLLWITILNIHFFKPANGALYLEIPFNTSQSFGYDGPWYAVPVTIGSDPQTLNLFPGSQWATTILSDVICGDRSNCASEKGGLYNYSLDNLTYHPVTRPTIIGADTIPYGQLFDAKGLTLGQFNQLGVGGGLSYVTIANASVLRVDAATLYYGKDRVQVQPSNGFLALGGLADYQTFGPYQPVIALNYLAATGKIESRTWGMHYSSAKLNQIPSLIWGGYDKSRISGPVQTFDLDSGGGMRMNLIGINIGVAIGKSPFPYQMKSNLLVNNIATGQGNVVTRVELESAIPYLVLPQETCDAIARELPVVFNASLGFYLWKTADPLYQAIVTSPAYLSLDFQVSASQNLTLKIPFALLDLNLTAPLVTDTQAYFPCMGGTIDKTTGDGAFLGRAFYQAVFIAKSFETSKFWIAQARGPSYTVSDIQGIDKTAVSLDAPPAVGDDTWVSSWNSSWMVVPLDTASSPTPKPSSGTSKTTMIGIAVGIGSGILLLALVFLLWRRKRKTVKGKRSLPVDIVGGVEYS
ncbi:hypothetical protein TWF694_004930 [Orbilia ellipsospora]|uniref:Peptidase A1 domain-containing protein n=1 Tax=Orbilia ellipsospora TaxID=2528407 RepID=A0AAV9WU59_9PEZI